MVVDVPTVHVIDDDPSIRDQASSVLESAGFFVMGHASAEHFLEQKAVLEAGPLCLLVDVRMPGMSGLALLELLEQEQMDVPVIFLSSHAETHLVVEAVRKGALDFLEKPIEERALLERVQMAVDRDAQLRSQRERRRDVAARLDSLSGREREVLELLVAGMNTKEISARLGIGGQTVAKHRANVLSTLGVRNIVELVHLVTSIRGNS